MKWIKKLLGRKNNKKTESKMDEAAVQRMIQLKESFTGQRFQWIKTQDANLLGKIVTCRDIQPTQRGRFMAYFDDGSKVDAGQINTKLMMLHEGIQPLSKPELQGLNRVEPSKTEVSNPNIVTDPSEVGRKPGAGPRNADPVPPKAIVEPKQAEPTSDMFAMFNADETTLAMNLKIKLPDKKLLKMMYNSAEDKKKFIDQLSSYVYSQINKSTIQDSLLKILDPPKRAPKKKNESEIKVTEVKDENN